MTDDALDALRRVLANEGNHYDRYWTPSPEPLTEEWLTDTEAKMREALTDAFCDDAAAVMLTLIAEIRRLGGVTARAIEAAALREVVEAARGLVEGEADYLARGEPCEGAWEAFVAALGAVGEPQKAELGGDVVARAQEDR